MKEYFKKSEFECKCGCGFNPVSDSLIFMLNKARDIAGIPFVINSGSRCMVHNSDVGGSPTSSHLKGLAVDIKCTRPPDRYAIVSALIESGFNRIGIAKDFIHADIDSSKSQDVIWVY